MAETATLSVWMDTIHVADIRHDARHDTWELEYSKAWTSRPDSFALSPTLPLPDKEQATRRDAPGSVKRFLENLLPEGRALDTVATSQALSKNNVFGLIRAIGAEATGAFRFLPGDITFQDAAQDHAPRLIPLAELHERITAREHRPLIEWDDHIRMSVAGFQDKLLVYVHPAGQENFAASQLYLPDYPLASTHILKPQPEEIEHMVVNEHYCMSLAKAMQLPVANVDILRTPEPVLVVQRFDRRWATMTEPLIATPTLPAHDGLRQVYRRHVIDACQAYDLPVSLKYERNFGSSQDVAHIRDGMSLPRLFRIAAQHAASPALAKRQLLHWTLFQLLIGNYDAHGKNFSFYVTPAGLAPTPWYDLVSVAQYPRFNNEMAMAIGDAFTLADVVPLELAQFAISCDIAPALLERETQRLCRKVRQTAHTVLVDAPYTRQELAFVQGIEQFVLQQAEWLEKIARLARDVNQDMLHPFEPELDNTAI